MAVPGGNARIWSTPLSGLGGLNRLRAWDANTAESGDFVRPYEVHSTPLWLTAEGWSTFSDVEELAPHAVRLHWTLMPTVFESQTPWDWLDEDIEGPGTP